MKGLKISFSILAIASIFSIIAVNATTSRTYAGIQLKAYSGEKTYGPATKTASGVQKYNNEYNLNLCTSNYNDVAVRVYSEARGNSDWITVSKGATSQWANNQKSNRADAYTLKIKNNVWGVCKSEHWGVWILDV